MVVLRTYTVGRKCKNVQLFNTFFSQRGRFCQDHFMYSQTVIVRICLRLGFHVAYGPLCAEKEVDTREEKLRS